jgi:hypothetical protein
LSKLESEVRYATVLKEFRDTTFLRGREFRRATRICEVRIDGFGG